MTPVLHRGHPDIGPAKPPQISQFVTVSWSWTDQANGNISWTFINSDTVNSHAVVLYRGANSVPEYIFGGAFWPIYLGPDDTVSHMLDGTQPIPTLTGTGGQPMGLLDFGAGATPRYLVAFIFNLGPGQTWSTPEGGFTGLTPTQGTCYALTSSVSGAYCVGYDPNRVAAWDNQTGTSNRGYSPDPSNFVTYAFTPEPTTPENTLGYNDLVAAGSCPVQNFYVVTQKNNYGRDEVQDTLSYSPAFFLFLEGFTPNAVGGVVPSLSGSFNNTNIPDLSITNTGTVYDVGSSGANAAVPQRIRFDYEVQFTTASLSVFPAPTGAPKPFSLGASFSVQSQPALQSPQAEMFLLGGDDPYLNNVNGTANNEFYRSQDLRVFTATPALNNTPVSGPGAPTLADSYGGAYTYIQQLITWLNQQYGYLNPNYTPPDTNFSDPLDTVLPAQDTALSGNSTVDWKSGTNNNYNFAIARVRLKGASGPSGEASNVKVFFRVFTTQTFDTDYINTTTAVTNTDPFVTYPSTGSLTDPQSPLPGTDGSGTINGCSLPFFATANYANNPSDYGSNGVNNQTIEIPTGQDYAWAFYGCFLNVYDPSNLINSHQIQYWLPASEHSCLVAQIAYTDAPIENTGGTIENPENSDKLAQRNLQIIPSSNPGYPATHIVPQSVDLRPSPPPQSADPISILSYPDEMMFDWGQVPVGSVANLYLPAVSASSVLQLASTLYPAQTLAAADANTIQWQVTGPVSYVPIPTGAGGSFAGLLTVQLPSTVTYGQQFDVLVRRISTRQVVVPPPPPPPPVPQLQVNAVIPQRLLWRYMTGSFLVRIPVQPDSTLLPGDENLLAVLKWRLGLIEPANRWYPVLLRYIGYLTGRIDGLGGNAAGIPASPAGYQPPTRPVGPVKEACYTGKVMGLFYDRFGDFGGFDLLTEEGQLHAFRACEHNLEELVYLAWVERFVITVCVDASVDRRVVSVALRRAPRPLHG